MSVPFVGYLIDYKGILVSVFTVAICGFLWGVFTLLEFLPIFVQVRFIYWFILVYIDVLSCILVFFRPFIPLCSYSMFSILSKIKIV